ncbi:hypothetical protein [Halobacillus sp. A5]|uniref:hypothetical protein n=1 Tax=Halobacillus sp. A5 TaxID=2880263 RepID=UPI0020A6ACBA|nr:hypothetical protein [Halobacillus sp. A5]MCP3027320.1 hypothetical protein [Halobacillus sp. A5]
MPFTALFFGLLLTGIFGGQFLIRLLGEGNFYYMEFGVGIAGLLLLITGIVYKSRRGGHSEKEETL